MSSSSASASQSNGATYGMPPLSQSAMGTDSLSCQWAGCSERASSPEALYDHVCEKHVGRKSTNNLNLQCQWGTCRTTTVKRDHITSHIRVHIPLKPHKCDFCGKSFKRPQDLKKHVKTHADDTVLMRSNDMHGGPRMTHGPVDGFHVGHMPRGPAMYSDNMHNGAAYGPAYGYPTHGSVAAMHPTPAYGAGTTPYGMGGISYDSGVSDTRKRNHDALDSFFGDVKRNRVDPFTYQDLGSRLGGLQSVQYGIATSGNTYEPTVYSGNYDGGHGFGSSTAAYAHAQPMPSMQPGSHAMGFNQIRTKSDLSTVDRFLEQLQTTVSQSALATAPAVAPSAHAHAQTKPGFGLTLASVSAPTSDHMAPFDPSGSGVNSPHSSVASIRTTPDLTPASHMSSHSPSSVHSAQFSASGQPSRGLQYPTLPPAAASQEGYVEQSYGVAPEGLDGSFNDYANQRRWSGGRLQRARPVDVDVSRGNEATGADAKATPTSTDDDTAASSSSSTDADASSPADETTHIIRTLREYLQFRLANGDYEDGDRDGDDASNRDSSSESASTPGTDEVVHSPVRESYDGGKSLKGKEKEGLYPSLPLSASAMTTTV